MCPQMHAQHTVVGKSSATNETDKSAPTLFTRAGVMVTHVFVEVAALCKRAIAQCTHVRTLPGVKSKVRLQVAALSKTAMAHLTNKRTVSCVNALMSLQVRRLYDTQHSTRNVFLIMFLLQQITKMAKTFSTPNMTFGNLDGLLTRFTSSFCSEQKSEFLHKG